MAHSKQATSAGAALHVVGPQDGIVGPLRILAGSEQTSGQYFALEWETASSGPGATADQMQALRHRMGIAGKAVGGADGPTVVSPPSVRVGGVVVSGQQTRNAYALRECSTLPEQAHEHADQEEAFYVISGELSVESEGVEVVLPARSFVVIPRLVRRWHATSAGTRLLAVFSPGDALPHYSPVHSDDGAK